MAKLQFDIRLPQAHPGDPLWKYTPFLYALECLTQINQFHMRNTYVPPLLQAGVRYREEQPGIEDWRDCLTVIEQGWGDCEDLAAWCTAEARQTDPGAKCTIKMKHIPYAELVRVGYPIRPRDGVQLIHVMTELSDGSLIDPSKLLGMRGEYSHTR